MSNAKTQHYATRNFRDAGTEREFEQGKPFPDDVSDGSIVNYAAAGLATTEKPSAAKVSTDKAAA